MAVVVQIVILLTSIGMAIQSINYLTTPIIRSPGIMPLVVAIAIAAIATTLLVLDLARGTMSPARVRASLTSRQFKVTAAKAAGWLSLATAYAVATPIVGFAWATAGFLVIALTVFGRLVWWQTALVALVMATGVPLVFRHLFFTIIP